MTRPTVIALCVFLLLGGASAFADVLHADSLDFTLDTTGGSSGLYADSADFTLDTTGGASGLYADSGDFTLDTTGTTPGLDIGLRVHDGTGIVKIAVEAAGTPGSPVRITRNGINYGIVLTETNLPDASKIRIQTSSGVKAWKKLP